MGTLYLTKEARIYNWAKTASSINGAGKTGQLYVIPFTIATKIIQYLGINLPKETKELYTENYDTSERNQRQHKQMERYSMFLGRKNQYCENDYYQTQSTDSV